MLESMARKYGLSHDIPAIRVEVCQAGQRREGGRAGAERYTGYREEIEPILEGRHRS